MAKKTYQVVKSVKKDGIELDGGTTVELDQSTGATLVDEGFLKEVDDPKTAEPKTKTAESPRPSGKKDDGL
jgi:hypothetical protein